MIVVDASALVHAFVVTRTGASFDKFRGVTEELHAPATVDAEVMHALRRLWLNEIISDADADDAIVALQRAPITRHPIHPFVQRMWQLRNNVTAYDAAYIALAETLDAPLVTRDARLARSAGHGAAVELIE